MNKKYVIILIAACALCLGAGIVIGMGISQNNLAATGATENSVDLPTAEDFAAMEPADLEIALEDYSDRLRIMEERQEAARKALDYIRNMDKEFESKVVTYDFLKNIRCMGAAEDDETFDFRFAFCFHLLHGYAGYIREGDLLRRTYNEMIPEAFEEALGCFDEAAADYKKAIDDIKKALSDKGVTY